MDGLLLIKKDHTRDFAGFITDDLLANRATVYRDLYVFLPQFQVGMDLGHKVTYSTSNTCSLSVSYKM